jgi:hypothetical protein
MMVRGINSNGDWLYGKGRNDYKRNKDAVAQNIRTRLFSFLGDCFFALEEGIDWWNVLGAKSIDAVTIPVRSTILNTEGVTTITQLDATLDNNRVLRLTYSVNTVYGEIIEDVTAFVDPVTGQFLLLESGDYLLLQDDGRILV